MIAERAAAVRERIARAAARAGRDPAAITLVAVSKTFPAAAVREAAACGLTQFGENRVQEAEAKLGELADLRPATTWHLLGHLQSNKARKAARLFDMVHSLDSLELAHRLEHYAAEAGRVLPVLVQVDLALEPTKSGLPEGHLLPVLESLRGFKSLRAIGLMLLPPYEDDLEKVRPWFRRLRGLREQALERGLLLGRELSMGMSHDFEVAVEEGATLVRVGTALFGERA